MGLGIWAMHYIGMLAFTLPVPVLYHYPTVILSLLAAIAASAVALFTVSRKQMALGSSIASSVMMGSGIASMHYIGMEAMRLPAMMEYRWNLVALSIVLAILISWVALILAFRVRQETASLRKLLSAVLMGIAIPLMHYTGMWAVRFHTCDVAFSTSHAVQISSLSIVAITLISILAMALAIASAFLDRILAAAQAARDGEARFHLQAEAIPQIVWTAVPGGGIDYCNRRWYELTGFSQEQTLGFGWKNALHPDDVPVATENWERSHKTGHAFDIECRLRCAAGGYRWHLVRATPMRDASATITKWFGACADIEDQKHNQQILEDEIKARTEELAEANVRLHAEMLERDHARQELDQQNATMLQDLTARSQRATLLAKMGELLQSCISKDEVFAAALGFAPKIFPTSRGAVALLNAGRDLVEVAGQWHDCQMPATVFEPNCC